MGNFFIFENKNNTGVLTRTQKNNIEHERVSKLRYKTQGLMDDDA